MPRAHPPAAARGCLRSRAASGGRSLVGSGGVVPFGRGASPQPQGLRRPSRGLPRDPPAHVSPARMVAYHAGDAGVSKDGRRMVERHVRECHACSADLLTLKRADAPKGTGPRRRFLGAAASVLIVVAAGWLIAGRRAEL